VSQQWTEVAFTVPTDAAEAWSEHLVEAGAGGVEERDSGTLERAQEGSTTLVVWLAPEEVEPYLARALEAPGLPAPTVARRDRQEDEWRDAWKRYFSARPVGRFMIVPSWEWPLASCPAGLVPLKLDPGRAFGTGGHATTRLCLEGISTVERAERVFDAGCGSGVLAIGCALLFPEATGLGVDVDRESVEVASENASDNGVSTRVEFSDTPIGEVRGLFEVVCANIQPEVLIPAAESLAARLAPGGHLFLSGILVEAAPSVRATYDALGLTLVDERDQEGWRLLHYRAP
jgi:ribosomal protein L11 methyltransferase